MTYLDYIALLKPRVMSLVVFTGFAGLAVAPGEMHPILAAVAVFCIALASGAAGAINMWYDRDIDALMERTRDRPLPTGKIEPAEALSFGVILAAGAIMLMFLATNAMAAVPAGRGSPVLCVRLHRVAETSHITEHRNWRRCWGLPAGHRMGGSNRGCRHRSRRHVPCDFLLDTAALLGAGTLSQRRLCDRRVPMLPVVRGGGATKRQMLLYTLLLAPLSMAPCFLGIAGWPLYGGAAIVLNAIFIVLAVAVMRDTTEASAKRMFGFSIFYLFALFAVLIADNSLAGML